MNILFYVEQHPIRELYTEHSWVVEKLETMLKDEFFHKDHQWRGHGFRMVLNSFQRKALKTPNLIEKPFVLSLNEKEEEDLRDFFTPWDEEALKRWKELQAGEGGAADFCCNILARLKMVYDFDVIVYWGTNGAVRRFAQERDIPAIALELGCTRAPFFPTVYVDAQGVNGLATPCSLPLEDAKIRCKLESLKTLLPYNFASESKGIEEICNALQISPPLREEILKEPEKNILIALQLKDDSNLQSYSSYESMLSMLEEIIPPLVAQGYRCFIKPHPASHMFEARRVNALDHEEAQNYCAGFENVFWIKKEDLRNSLNLLQKVSTVISVNSSVGFEAMLLGKTVIALGQASYNKPGMLPSFEDFISGNVNQALVRQNNEKIVNYFLFSYLVPFEKFFHFSEFCFFIKRAVLLGQLETSQEVKEMAELLETWSLKEGIHHYKNRSNPLLKVAIPVIRDHKKKRRGFLYKVRKELRNFSFQRLLPRKWRPKKWVNSGRN